MIEGVRGMNDRWVVEEREGRGRCIVAKTGFAVGDEVMRSPCVSAVLHYER